MSLISAGIAVASVVVNDYFDLKVDTTNAPDKPLPSGACRVPFSHGSKAPASLSASPQGPKLTPARRFEV